MRIHIEEAVILKRRNIGEKDKIITVFTKKYGKISVKAKGVRKITSKRSPHIELFNLTQISLYKSSVNFMPILTEAHIIEDFSNIKKHLRKIGYAYYICELINGLTAENQENLSVFYLLKSTLYNLCHEDDELTVISNFERKLLEILGFWTEARLLKNYSGIEVVEKILERKLLTKKVLHAFHD